ncbi:MULTISPECIES: hydantoinase/oxoprolinase family protein [Prauserella salsuginis group]|uniref:Hydantoinase/oxoprolinase family protein n=1 Tax=Prauserella salsuginis TaxID=387889 RepID=A0ABW6FZS1_9PSEU|nr:MULTISPECIES: hydantoinase/oxoprolinase family protein [Prauserella salsuginis group]MCR3720120.1 N-methylhydantoinase A [Prauserella flava]MCR3734171.1 N-methylhydantoinase A [Prauserella salsuginis]
MTLRIGVDTGGTFTDVCALDERTGRISVRKVPSTPDDPGRAIVDGVSGLLDELGGRQLAEVGYFAHGTTVGTNALLTEGGARTGLLTTEGFRDLLELGRGRRPAMYDPQADKPGALVGRDRRLEVSERVRHDGRIERDLDPEQVRQLARELGGQGVEAVAVCFLYSFVHPEHEREVERILAEELPGVYVSISSAVLPEFREYERLSTVVINAYIGPVVSRYLARLRGKLRELGLTATPHVTQSNGGIIPFETAERTPSRMVLSGPSTGVVGAAELAGAAGYPDIITFDVGGTSSDVSLVQDGVPKVTNGTEIDGRPVRAPMLDIHTVGAGGGSIAWIDAGGALKVGPASAGADPGPACYGSGTEPTVTDANVVLRVLNPEHLLDGGLDIDADAARRAVESVAEPLGLDVLDAAAGIVRVITANMARAIRVISVQRGYDPRDYALVPFGGAGPLHASRLARELDMPAIVIPETPGAQCAAGLLMTDIRADFLRTNIMRVEEGRETDAAERLAEVLDGLGEQASAWLAEENVPEGRRNLERWAELRYAGQNYELPVRIPDGDVTAATIDQLAKRFAAEHERLYGYAAPDEQLQIVTVRLRAIGEVARAELQRAERAGTDASAAIRTTREVYVPEAGGFVSCPVYDRSRLEAGNRFDGPAVIEQMDTTTLLLPGDVAEVDALRNIVVEVGQ